MAVTSLDGKGSHRDRIRFDILWCFASWEASFYLAKDSTTLDDTYLVKSA
jgi:hypothetical protein